MITFYKKTKIFSNEKKRTLNNTLTFLIFQLRSPQKP